MKKDTDDELRRKIKRLILDSHLASNRGISQYEVAQQLAVPRDKATGLLSEMEISGLLKKVPHPKVRNSTLWIIKPVGMEEKIELIDITGYLMQKCIKKLLKIPVEDRKMVLENPALVLNDLTAIVQELEKLWRFEPDDRQQDQPRPDAPVTAHFLIKYCEFFVELARAPGDTIASQLMQNVMDRLLFSRLVFPGRLKTHAERLKTWFQMLYDDSAGAEERVLRGWKKQHSLFIERLEAGIKLLPQAQGGGAEAQMATEKLCRLVWPMIYRTILERRYKFNAWPTDTKLKEVEVRPEIVAAVHKVIGKFDPESDSLPAWIVRIACRSVFHEPAEVLDIVSKVSTPIEWEVLMLLYADLSDAQIETRLKKTPLRHGKQRIRLMPGFWSAALRAKKHIHQFLSAELASMGLSASPPRIRRGRPRERTVAPVRNRLIQYLELDSLLARYDALADESAGRPTTTRRARSHDAREATTREGLM